MDGDGVAALAGTLRSASPEDTHEVGRRLGASAEAGTLIALVGPLGAGKTQLAKGVAAGLGVTSVVNSPTFILMNEHVGRLPMFHIDAYRIDDVDDAAAAGLLDERQAGGVAVIEWADRLSGSLPVDRLHLEIKANRADPTGRTLRWQATGPRHVALARRSLTLAAVGDGPPATR